ncbi:hypothetical protein L4G92_05355 [Neisseria sp. ZJ106]|uniref:GAF domain-containing protein n=1 Tax=Neisseria lisongii TaxID=2912188 RepID=A0ABY7RPU6_9NEIS|nr:hypothetical protein [Neisseria lisongii]MCF7521475.1 hypothetical protein [Neisseria lisongii]WCL72275.1 hypothetical protein PJU73_04015 [Neisseria lisongii]
MPALLIEDFLQTQGLRLQKDDVAVAYAAAKAVVDMGEAAIERPLLWHCSDELVLADFFAETAENTLLLKKIFMALDSVFSRSQGVAAAAVYALMPSENRLVRLTAQGVALEAALAVDEFGSQTYLVVRTAQSAWMNIAADTAAWAAAGELFCSRNQHGAQISVPVCAENGTVLGVIQVEFEHPLPESDDTPATEWVALALALIEPLKQLLNFSCEDETL